MDIRKGEHVLHAQHGIGTITSAQSGSFSGDASTNYVQLYFERDEITMIVRREDLCEVVRELMSSDEARQLLDHVTAWDGKPSTRWRHRAAAHQAALDSGNPFEYGKVLKGLAPLDRDGSLSSLDRKHLSTCLHLLTEELSYALQESPQRVQGLLDEAIGIST